ncbi:hypothetical protein RRG08_067095 [Elysia crispata]|uniref:Uncharacterized protein n=1 Tax=Elysia crispata TaxID=231223 RepID=A0AAE1B7Z9_9GAST|nr:hypothetical protein RRG08_067095 [Elysia crispata]
MEGNLTLRPIDPNPIQGLCSGYRETKAELLAFDQQQPNSPVLCLIPPLLLPQYSSLFDSSPSPFSLQFSRTCRVVLLKHGQIVRVTCAHQHSGGVALYRKIETRGEDSRPIRADEISQRLDVTTYRGYCSMPSLGDCSMPSLDYCRMPSLGYCSMPSLGYCSMPSLGYCRMPPSVTVACLPRLL